MTSPDLSAAEYILPLRWTEDSALPDLAAYLRRLSTWLPVTVVDGSAPELFEQHRAAFPPSVRHIRPDMAATGPGSTSGGGNGKVAGVLAGVRAAGAELLVIADDDVRYTLEALTAVVRHLESADIVRPQNYFRPLPWHALWDTARTLINRALSADFPGTLAVRRSAVLATGGYDAVLFENLELIRTIKAAGGREALVPALFVARTPPTARHFLKQRVRQAYDDFAQPARLAAELALLPAILGAACLPARHRRRVFPALAAVPVLLAAIGRRRDHGTAVFPARAVWLAPLWALERAACIWVALAFRLTGGVPYAGARLKTAAHSEAELRRRHCGTLAAARRQQAAALPLSRHSPSRAKQEQP